MPDHALDSMLDARDLPVKEKADGTSAQLEIGKGLSMNNVCTFARAPGGMDPINSFVFAEYACINQRRPDIHNQQHALFVAVE